MAEFWMVVENCGVRAYGPIPPREALKGPPMRGYQGTLKVRRNADGTPRLGATLWWHPTPAVAPDDNRIVQAIKVTEGLRSVALQRTAGADTELTAFWTSVARSLGA